MSAQSKTITLANPDATSAIARTLAGQLRPGDVLLLTGGIGAGKTHFARTLIQSILIEPEDVPSPTFTLVQVYETRLGELWHSDLYRLGGADDCVELGLTEAFDTAICLVEWPDKLEELRPDKALDLTFEDGTSDEERRLTAKWTNSRWDGVLEAERA